MSRILRRPMFRGGRVDSRGTGIASGLSYAKGGRVGLQGGGTGRALMNVPQPPKYSRPIGPPTGGLGMGTGKFRFPMLSSQARAAMSLGFPSLSTLGLMSLPFAPTAAMAAMNMPKTDAALQFMKDAPDFTFDETNIDVGDFYDELSRKNKEGTPISTLDAFFLDPETGTYPKFMGRLEDREKRAAIEKAKKIAEEGGDIEEELTQEEKDILGLKDTIKTLEAQLTEALKPKKSTEEEDLAKIEKNKKMFEKAYGSGVADDASRMLLSAAGRLLEPEATVKSAAGKFFGDESKVESKRSKYKDAATTAAINAYLTGEKDYDSMMKQMKLIDYQIDAKTKGATDLKKTWNLNDYVMNRGTGVSKTEGLENGIRDKIKLNPEYTNYKKIKSKENVPELIAEEYVGVIFMDEGTREVFAVVMGEDGPAKQVLY